VSKARDVYDQIHALRDEGRKHFQVVVMVVVAEDENGGWHTRQLIDGDATPQQTLDIAESLATMNAQLIRGVLSGQGEVVDVQEPPP